MSDCDYDSRPETLLHSLRVGALMTQMIQEAMARAVQHDLSKTEDPEVKIFNKYTPMLKTTTYGSPEYNTHLVNMGEGLLHHYYANRHHPEHFSNGINDMTLVDLMEMLADWKAASERHSDGSLTASLPIQAQRFNISPQLLQILTRTAEHFGWLP